MVLVIENGECDCVSDVKWRVWWCYWQNEECDGVSDIKCGVWWC